MLPPCSMVARLGLPLCDVRSLGSLRRRGGGENSGREPGTDASRASAGPAARAVAVLLLLQRAALGWNQFLKAEKGFEGSRDASRAGAWPCRGEDPCRKPVLCLYRPLANLCTKLGPA